MKLKAQKKHTSAAMINWPMIRSGDNEPYREVNLFAISFKDDETRAFSQWKCWLMNAQIAEAAAKKDLCPKT